MNNLSELKLKIKQIQNKLKTDFCVEEIGLFGSYVRGEETKNSDLDVLITLQQNHDLGLIKFNLLKDYLSDLLELKVDLVTKDGIKPALKDYILEEVVYL